MILKHSVYDTDTHFSIDPATRALNNEALQKTSLIQNDHNCERFTFELPRTIEGHDMSKCDIVQVHYINIDAQTKAQSKGVYEVTDMQISPDGDDVVICSWLIPQTATKYVGSLSFLLRFCCIADDGKTLHYVWHTAIYSGISVSNGIYNGEIVSEEFPEILREWQKELHNNMIASVEQTTATAADGGLNVWTMRMGDGRTFDFKVYNGRAGDITIIQQPPQFVDSIEECTDTTKLYVLPDGYIYHYKDTTIVHPAEREETAIDLRDGYELTDSVTSDGKYTLTFYPSDDYCCTMYIDLTDMPKPCHIDLKGVMWGAPSNAGSNDPCGQWAAVDNEYEAYGAYFIVDPGPLTPRDDDDLKVVHNNGTFTDVTITIKSDRVKRVAFSGLYASGGGAGSYDTAEAVLYYNVTEETVEKVQGWYSTGHTWGGGEGGAGVGILRITESTVDGGSNVVTFTDGTTLTIKNGKKGSTGAQGEKGDTGAAGYTPIKGVDYFTEADKEAMVESVIKALPNGDEVAY